jgi:hypothetical protein
VQNFVGIHPDEEQRSEGTICPAINRPILQPGKTYHVAERKRHANWSMREKIDFQANSSRAYLLETYKEFNPVLLRVMEYVHLCLYTLPQAFDSSCWFLT